MDNMTSPGIHLLEMVLAFGIEFTRLDTPDTLRVKIAAATSTHYTTKSKPDSPLSVYLADFEELWRLPVFADGLCTLVGVDLDALASQYNVRRGIGEQDFEVRRRIVNFAKHQIMQFPPGSPQYQVMFARGPALDELGSLTLERRVHETDVDYRKRLVNAMQSNQVHVRQAEAEAELKKAQVEMLRPDAPWNF
jgi:hypothetical protein